MKKTYTLVISCLLLAFPLMLKAQLEQVTDVTLTFTPKAGGDPIVATATDSGSGLAVQGNIMLGESSEYDLSISVANGAQDLNSTINSNGDDYLVFFGFGEDLFESPNGEGNIEGGLESVSYSDEDGNGQPIGLLSSWTTTCTEESGSGSFRVVLSLISGAKSDTNSVAGGASQFDLSWDMMIIDDPNAPPCENEEEIITNVTLTFTSEDSSSVVVATAIDPDGEGPLGLQVQGDVELMESTDYDLSITLTNEIEGEDITEEIEEEDDEHMFFFGFSEDLFESPDGDGNLDARDDPVNYNDFDDNGFPVGLSTSWTTSCTEEGNATGTFEVILKHQPDIKSATSTVDDGGTDVELEWNFTIVDDPNAPPCENEEEIITNVTLTFTSEDSSSVVVATAIDPDGEGPLGLQVQGDVELMESTDYDLSITLTNEIEGEDITEEIEEEDDEHMFFFGFSEDLFESPDGDGNLDARDDPVNYNDFDDNGFPVGLSTSWTTSCTEEGNATGTFEVILKHQPDIKSATSTVDDGGTDVELEWNFTIVDDPNAPPCENEEEIITNVDLTFTSEDSSSVVVATAVDPDGEGPLDLQVTGDGIGLLPNTTYTLSISLRNEIEGEDITEEIEEEDDEHMFFFGWTEGLFASPEGNGNVDGRDDPVNYNDFDDNGFPVGLSTSWTTGDSVPSGTFEVILKHQPDVKSATSTVDDGGTDVELSWNIGQGTPTRAKKHIEKSGLTVYPNPANYQLNWSVESGKVNELRLFDMMGKAILSIPQPANTLDVSKLPNGTYILILSGDQQIWRQRIVIKK